MYGPSVLRDVTNLLSTAGFFFTTEETLIYQMDCDVSLKFTQLTKYDQQFILPFAQYTGYTP